jgi:hypothetical protein
MAAINLDSLSTFWQSIKSWIRRKIWGYTVLYNGAASSSVALSDSVLNYEWLRIYIHIVDSQGNPTSQTFIIESNRHSNALGYDNSFEFAEADIYINWLTYKINERSVSIGDSAKSYRAGSFSNNTVPSGNADITTNWSTSGSSSEAGKVIFRVEGMNILN